MILVHAIAYSTFKTSRGFIYLFCFMQVLWPFQYFTYAEKLLSRGGQKLELLGKNHLTFSKQNLCFLTLCLTKALTHIIE